MSKKLVNRNLSTVTNMYHNAKAPLEVTYRKELSPLGRLTLVALYSFALIFMTKNYVSKTNGPDDYLSASLQSLEDQQAQVLMSLRNNKPTQSLSVVNHRFLKKEITDLEHQLHVLKNNQDKSKILIREQISQINDLTEKLKLALITEVDREITRSPKFLSYSRTNSSNLIYRHDLKVRKLRRKHRERELLFTDNLDMSDPRVREKYESLVESQKIELNDLKNKLYEKRMLFRKQKYINLADN